MPLNFAPETAAESAPVLLPDPFAENLPAEAPESVREFMPENAATAETETRLTEGPVEETTPPAEGPLTARIKRVWITGLLLALALVVALGWGLIKRGTHAPATAPIPQAPEPVPVPVLPPPPDEPTKTTTGKMAAMLDALSNYSRRNQGSLPMSLLELNKGYTAPALRLDGWGRELSYLVDTLHKTFVLRSPGPDGTRDTPDDLLVSNEDAESWLQKNEALIAEWKSANPGLYAQMTALGISAEELKRLEAARKAEEERQKKEAENRATLKRQEEERRQQEERQQAAEAEKQRQLEVARQEEEARQARLREEAQARQRAHVESMKFSDDFTSSLTSWEAPADWETALEKKIPIVKIKGFGLLKAGQDWDNYQAEFEVKINKEAAAWVLRATNSQNFYLFKLSGEKAEAVPKNSLMTYVFSEGQYLNSARREDAPGAAFVALVPFKIRAKEYFRVRMVARGHTITHFINDTRIDSWTDNTFSRGRFGFNANLLESFFVRYLRISPAEP
jgi:hypothetical protein